MLILGLDPGLQCTGYGLIDASVEPTRIIEAGVIRSDSNAPMAARLCELADGLRGLLAQHEAQAVAVEELYAHYDHPRTAIIMGHARGVLLMAAGNAKVPVHTYAATRIKKSLTGNGRATKAQMQRTIASRLGLPTVPEPADVADALAIALCHAETAARGVTV